jgi:chromosome partitioning protein
VAKGKREKALVIGVVSQKGGVGKSTLCQLIAREAAAQGRAAKILDFDVKQMSSVDWVRARLERDFEPAVEAEPTKDVKKALKLNRDYDVLVLDGAPGTPKRTAELIGECDLVVLPTGASRADLARATIGAAGFTILDGELIERPGYRVAQNLGRSPSETAFPSLNAKAKNLARAILERLG